MVTRRTVLGTGSGALLLLVGCSPDSEPGAGPSASAPGSTSPTPSPTPSATSTPSPTPTAVEPVTDLDATDLVTGLTSPWGLAFFADGAALVTERDTGRILHLVEDEVSEVGRIDDAVPSSEGGTLGVAIAPDEKTVFVYYSRSGENQLVALPWNGSRLGTAKVLLGGVPLAQTHNGGQLLITPDEHLFVSTGDARAPEDSQDTDSLAGKILRLDLDGKPASDNPFDNEVWSYGHRNVQGLALDDHGRLWASEFGDQSTDELNLIIAGENYRTTTPNRRRPGPPTRPPPPAWPGGRAPCGWPPSGVSGCGRSPRPTTRMIPTSTSRRTGSPASTAASGLSAPLPTARRCCSAPPTPMAGRLRRTATTGSSPSPVPTELARDPSVYHAYVVIMQCARQICPAHCMAP